MKEALFGRHTVIPLGLVGKALSTKSYGHLLRERTISAEYVISDIKA